MQNKKEKLFNMIIGVFGLITENKISLEVY
jgi:hypothetical protein